VHDPETHVGLAEGALGGAVLVGLLAALLDARLGTRASTEPPGSARWL
jgi:hypothetical protein